jgi:hypothetical protein
VGDVQHREVPVCRFNARREARRLSGNVLAFRPLKALVIQKWLRELLPLRDTLRWLIEGGSALVNCRTHGVCGGGTTDRQREAFASVRDLALTASSPPAAVLVCPCGGVRAESSAVVRTRDFFTGRLERNGHGAVRL